MSRLQVAIRISTKAPPEYSRRRRLWQMFAQDADVWEHRLIRIMEAYFRRLKAEVLERLTTLGPSVEGQYRGWSRRKVVQHISQKSPIDRINIDRGRERRALVQLFEPVIRMAMERRGGEFVNAQLGSTIQFNVNDPEVMQYLGTRMDEFSRQVSGTTFDAIKATLRTGFTEGVPLSSIADTLRQTFDSFEKYRAPLIARTETISALNRTDLFAIQQAKIGDMLVKSWLTAGDEAVRDSHREAGAIYQAEPIGVEELFTVGGDAMPAPALGKDPAENINCRCTVEYRKKGSAALPGPRGAPPSKAPWKTKFGKIKRQDLNLVGTGGTTDATFGGVTFDTVEDGSRINASRAKRRVMQNVSKRLEGNKAFEDAIEFAYDEYSGFDDLPGDNPREKVVSWLIGRWAGTSGDNSAVSVALQLAAKEEFGLNHAVISHFHRNAISKAEMNILPKAMKGFRAFLRAQYEETQAYFRAKGIREITVARGMSIPEEATPGWLKLGKTTTGTLQLQPISSYSTNWWTAHSFSSGGGGTHVASIVKVPVERVLGTPLSGFGCQDEFEAVILGGVSAQDETLLYAWQGYIPYHKVIEEIRAGVIRMGGST